MPRAGSPSSKRNEAAEARILDAAWRLYAEHGLRGAAFAHRARGAGNACGVQTPCRDEEGAPRPRVQETVRRPLEAGMGCAPGQPKAAARGTAVPLLRRVPRQHRAQRRAPLDAGGIAGPARVRQLQRHARQAYPDSDDSRTAPRGRRFDGPRTVTGEEIELAQVLHGAIAFPHTRSHLFGMDVHGTLKEIVPMAVRVWLPGAKVEVRRLCRRCIG